MVFCNTFVCAAGTFWDPSKLVSENPEHSYIFHFGTRWHYIHTSQLGFLSLFLITLSCFLLPNMPNSALKNTTVKIYLDYGQESPPSISQGVGLLSRGVCLSLVFLDTQHVPTGTISTHTPIHLMEEVLLPHTLEGFFLLSSGGCDMDLTVP